MQAAMRLRPNIHEKKIIVFLTAEPVDIPVTPVAFSLSDGNGFDGNWATFVENLQKREDASVAELVDAGVSERTAQRLTELTRKQKKADRNAEILRRDTAGETQQQIKEALGIGLATVNRVLKKAKF